MWARGRNTSFSPLKEISFNLKEILKEIAFSRLSTPAKKVPVPKKESVEQLHLVEVEILLDLEKAYVWCLLPPYADA